MTDTIDELGPVDYIVVEFPGNKFNGEIAPALGDLIDRNIVKVLDLVFITKDADGTIEGFELERPRSRALPARSKNSRSTSPTS